MDDQIWIRPKSLWHDPIIRFCVKATAVIVALFATIIFILFMYGVALGLTHG